MSVASNQAASAPSRLFIFTVVAILWMMTRPYGGIIIDAQFYTVQALSHIQPAKFADDLYLKYGSQDQFSIYSLFLAGLIRLTGIAAANFLAELAGACLFITSCWYLLHALKLNMREAAAGLWAAILLPAVYGDAPWNISYAQSFQTPRIFVESFVLFSIGLVLRGAWARAALLLLLALLLHPLMAAAVTHHDLTQFRTQYLLGSRFSAAMAGFETGQLLF